jgi:hypothetical protein
MFTAERQRVGIIVLASRRAVSESCVQRGANAVDFSFARNPARSAPNLTRGLEVCHKSVTAILSESDRKSNSDGLGIKSAEAEIMLASPVLISHDLQTI